MYSSLEYFKQVNTLLVHVQVNLAHFSLDKVSSQYLEQTKWTKYKLSMNLMFLFHRVKTVLLLKSQ